MPRILIAGCGYVGTATAQLFHEAGWEVEGWTATANSARELGALPFRVRAVDITDREAVAAGASDCQAVVQCASSRGGTVDDYRRIYLDGARNLGLHFPQALLVFASSTSVYAQTGGEWVTESSADQPERATARVLREAEDFVLQGGGIVVRLAGIYGPGRSALLEKFLAGTAVLDPESDRFINQVHRDDAAAALLQLTQTAVAGGFDGNGAERKIFNVADDHPISLRQSYEWLAARLRRPIPQVVEESAAGRRGNGNKRVSSARLRTLGWFPRYPTFRSAMAESILPAAGF